MLSRQYLKVHFNTLRYLSTAAQPERLQSFRTTEGRPSKHSTNNLAEFYTIDSDVRNQIFTHGGIPKSYNIQTKTFGETAVTVRQPAVDIIYCLKAIDYTKPPIKFVLHGKKGVGN